MRYKTGALVAATALAVLGYSGLNDPQDRALKLAYINSNEIIAQAPGAQEAQATFDREMASWRTQVQSLSDSLQQMITAYEQQQVMLSPEARQQRQQQIQAKRVEFQQRAADLEVVAQRRQQELVEPIYERITNVLVKVRDENNYTMIFDAAAGALIAADTALDITDAVIDRLRAQDSASGKPAN